VFHYVPLHSAPGAVGRARFSGTDRFTTTESERLIRLPLWFGMSNHAVERVINAVREVFASR
jgi:dTDP-4-amino-4,6-dideoxygalactose transaminase